MFLLHSFLNVFDGVLGGCFDPYIWHGMISCRKRLISETCGLDHHPRPQTYQIWYGKNILNSFSGGVDGLCQDLPRYALTGLWFVVGT